MFLDSMRWGRGLTAPVAGILPTLYPHLSNSLLLPLPEPIQDLCPNQLAFSSPAAFQLLRSGGLLLGSPSPLFC